MKAVDVITACALASLAACGGSPAEEAPRQHARFASLGFDMPVDWQHTDDTTATDVKTTTWRPDDKDNERNETITILRSERSPALRSASAATLEHVLTEAQQSLPEARAFKATSTTTSAGLTWARIDVDFVPPGKRESYHRVHVVLVDHGALVNVLYTARTPDHETAVLSMVLASIHHEGA